MSSLLPLLSFLPGEDRWERAVPHAPRLDSWIPWEEGGTAFRFTSTAHSHAGCASKCASVHSHLGPHLYSCSCEWTKDLQCDTIAGTDAAENVGAWCIDYCCHKEPATLACLDSAEKTHFLFPEWGTTQWGNLAASPSALHWIGHLQYPNRQGSDVGWRPTAQGCDATWTNWNPGEPNDRYVLEDCAAVGSQGTWHDYPCWEALPCLCERTKVLVPEYTFNYAMAIKISGDKEYWALLVYVGTCLQISFVILAIYCFCTCRHKLPFALQRDVSRMRSAAILTRLRGAGAASRLLRARVQSLLLCLAAVALVWATAPLFYGAAGLWPQHSLGEPGRPLSFIPIGIVLALMALRPTDASAIRGLCVVIAVGSFFMAEGSLLLANQYYLERDRTYPAYFVCFTLVFLAMSFAAGTSAAASMPSRRRLFWMITTVRCAFCLIGIISLISPPVRYFFGYDPVLFKQGMLVGASCILGAVGLHPRLRAIALEFLGRLGSTEEEQQAAMIASLCSFGKLASAELLDSAEAHFRVIRFDRIQKKDIVSSGLRGPGASPSQNVGSTAESLAERTEHCELGEADVFLSHSWHDAAEPKWRALKGWAMTFEDENGRPPTIWLDKACIDQSNIAESLPCLPIYLAGCKTLLVVAGQTYSSRLWCVMELFTFLKMGASLDRCVVITIADGKTTTERYGALHAVAESLANFDAREAQCFKPEDRQALLAVIESSFGGFNQFNHWARTIFSMRLQAELPQPITPEASDIIDQAHWAGVGLSREEALKSRHERRSCSKSARLLMQRILSAAGDRIGVALGAPAPGTASLV